METPSKNPSANRISPRVGSLAESATLAVDAQAKKLKAAGRPVISFGAGEPDFPTPGYIVDAAVDAARDPRNHRYSPAAGLPELREAIAAKTLRDSGFQVDPSQVVVTNGGKQAVFQALLTLLGEGDELILPTPYWTTYPEVVKLAGATTVEVFAGESQGYKVDVRQLEAARTPRTKALMFVSPSNPTGAVYTPEEVRQIGLWAANHGIWVITDEIYEHLTYGEARFASIAALVPELGDRVVVLNGVAKTYAMTGWRVGWMIAPADVAKAVSNLQSHATSNVSNVSQRAALAAVSGPLDEVERMKEAFDRRRRAMVAALSAIPGVKVPVPEGAFYVYADVNGLLGRDINGQVAQTSARLAEIILEQAEVAVVPGEAFGPSGYLRFSYALGDDDLGEGMERLTRLLG